VKQACRWDSERMPLKMLCCRLAARLLKSKGSIRYFLFAGLQI